MIAQPKPDEKRARQIAVVSGKGGTGKTTIAATLAAMVAPLVLADADVEAANLGLVFGVKQTEAEAFPGLPLAVVDPAACTGCGVCVELCRFGAIAPIDLDNPVADIDLLACEGCGVCVDNCPVDAIAGVPAQAGVLFVGRSSLGPMVSAELEPGQDLSGRLTTLVRQRAVKEAEEAGLDLILIDGPPGTGCPTIATITGVDALIAVAEPTAAGTADLIRLMDLAGRFDLIPSVIINKIDLSPQGAAVIEAACADRGAHVIARIPFIEGVSRWLEDGAPLQRLPEALQPLHAVAAGLRSEGPVT